MAKKKLTEPIDVQITNAGNIYLFRPYTDEAKAWIAENVDPDAQWFAGGLVVEHRYAEDLAAGMQKDGLTVK